ncbi:MAG TPA: rhomboid family intramembrane serine protease [Dokdonella sp.]
MLILPLHRTPRLANLPWAALALILTNVFVFCVLQSGDDERLEGALDGYVESGLAREEFPAYHDWLAAQDASAERAAEFDAWVEAGATQPAAQQLQSDAAFVAALHAGHVPGVGGAEWRARRDEFERRWNAVFTERWLLRYSELAPRRLLGSMFLHGSAGHLFGNLLFLAVLGLLVEGALGPWLFLAVYLLGGIGSGLFSLAWHWGDAGGVLGASGAIASLMGAYCVLWGRRRVRFFWWFFVAFDYVKAPALVLLPAWLGWEVLNLFWNRDAGVAFDAHAGGIVVGAVLGAIVRALGWERREFLDEDVAAETAAADAAALERAQAHIGRLEIAAARALLEPLAERRPHDFAVRAALYRCARYEPQRPRLRAAARAALVCAAAGPAELREQKAIFDDCRAAAGGNVPLSATELVALARRWPAIGAGADAAELVGRIVERAPATEGLVAAALALAGELRVRGDPAAARPLLERVARAYAGTPPADAAQGLLAAGLG